MTAFSTLVAAIDPSNTGAAWHFADAVTSVGKVTSIPDCLARAGRTLTGVGTTKPAWDATNGITTDGVQNYLETGAQALYDLSTGPITIVVACTNPTTGNFPVVLYDPTFARLIGIGAPGGVTVGVRQRLINAAQVDINTGLVPDSGMHLYVFTSSDTNSPLGSTHGFSGIQAYPLPRRVFAMARSDVTTDRAAGSNDFSIGAAVGSGFYATLFRWAIVLRKDLSASDMDAIVAFAQSDTAVVPYASVGTKSIVAYGDSLLQGFNATTPATDNPLAQLVSLGSLPGFATANASIGGTRLWDWMNYYPNQVATDYLGNRSLNIAWIGTGSNDLTDTTAPGPWTDVGVISQYTTFAATLHARGFKVCIPTIIVRAGFTTQQNTYKDSINTWVRNTAVSAGVADIVVDPASAPELADFTNLTYFNADQTHLTTLGYNKYAVACQAGMAAGLARLTSVDLASGRYGRTRRIVGVHW